MVRTWTAADGSTKVEGGKDLKASQAYPAGFGRAVAKLLKQNSALVSTRQQRIYAKALAQGAPTTLMSKIMNFEPAQCSWSEAAELASVIEYLKKQA